MQIKPQPGKGHRAPENNVMWFLSQAVPEAKTDGISSDNLAARLGL